MELLEEAVKAQGLTHWTAWCISQNEAGEQSWEKAKKTWKENAAIHEAQGIPLPPKPLPAKVWKVIQIQGTPEEPTAYLAIAYGPEYVADPTLDLPQKPAPPTGGIAKVGEPWPGWPGVWRALPGDTLKDGQVHIHEGKTLIRKSSPQPFPAEYYVLKP